MVAAGLTKCVIGTRFGPIHSTSRRAGSLSMSKFKNMMSAVTYNSTRANEVDNLILSEKHHDMGVIKLNRPKAFNAIDYDMAKRLQAGLQAWDGDNRIKMASLKSASEKAFFADGDVKNIQPRRENKASLDQLNKVADHLTRYLPHFFSSPHPFMLYSKDVVFIDKTRSIRTQGIGSYTLQIALVKIYHSLTYTSNRLELLNLAKDPEESSIKIRWRFVSKPGLLRFMLTFYRYHGTEIWKDAISTLHVNKDGKIYHHVCDNIEVEKEGAKAKKVVKNPLVNKGINV